VGADGVDVDAGGLGELVEARGPLPVQPAEDPQADGVGDERQGDRLT
jgi:hypothetical protein